jgi:WD40 repeat protein
MPPTSRLSMLDLSSSLLPVSSSALASHDESMLCNCIHSAKKRAHDGSYYLPCLASPKSAYQHAIARTLYASQSNTIMADPLLRHLYECLPISSAQQPRASKAHVSVSEAWKRSQINVHQYYRSVTATPERVLDAPGLLDDFYLHLLDWGPTNCLAVALGPSVYLWNANSGSVSELMSVNETLAVDAYVSSLKWVQSENDPPILAIGTSEGTVQLWNVAAERKLRELKYASSKLAMGSLSDTLAPHRVSSLAWNSSILSSGHRAGHIFHSDVRVAQHQVSSMAKAHQHDVCGLAWSPDGAQLASGGNDNVLNVWEGLDASTPRHSLTQHTAAVKALAWCPWRSRLLASGGGSADQSIRTWNTTTGACLSATHTGSQVTSLLWSPDSHSELISSHGFSENQIVIWRYPSMTKLAELKNHAGRIVSLAMSPNGRTVVSAGADENLNFWSVYPEHCSALTKQPTAVATRELEGRITTPTTRAASRVLELSLPSPPTQSSPGCSFYRNMQALSPCRTAASPLLKLNGVALQLPRSAQSTSSV